MIRWHERWRARRYRAASRPAGERLELLKLKLKLRSSMATCPSCGVSSRDDPTAMVMEPFYEARAIGTFSLAGRTMKVSAVAKATLTCRCGWSIVGRLEDDHLVIDPPNE